MQAELLPTSAAAAGLALAAINLGAQQQGLVLVLPSGGGRVPGGLCFNSVNSESVSLVSNLEVGSRVSQEMSRRERERTDVWWRG